MKQLKTHEVLSKLLLSKFLIFSFLQFATFRPDKSSVQFNYRYFLKWLKIKHWFPKQSNLFKCYDLYNSLAQLKVILQLLHKQTQKAQVLSTAGMESLLLTKVKKKIWNIWTLYSKTGKCHRKTSIMLGIEEGETHRGRTNISRIKNIT